MASAEKPNDLWESLPHEQQVAAARATARRLRKAWRGRLKNFLGAGVGWRYSGGERRREVVVQVLVSRKWGRPRKDAAPRRVPAFVRVRGRKVRCWIPTDVEPIGVGGPQGGAALSLDAGVRGYCDPFGTTFAGGSVGGAAAAVVTVDPPDGRFFVLGCHHVFTCSLLRASQFGDWESIEGARVCLAGAQGPLVGPTVRWTRLQPDDGGFGMDAALAQVHAPEGVTKSVQGVRPRSLASDASLASAATLWTPNGQIAVEVASHPEELSLPYLDSSIPFRSLIRYHPDSPTLDGDSGSPLVAPGGVLLGMHIWGGVASDANGDRPVAFALPAWALLGQPLFDDLAALRLA